MWLTLLKMAGVQKWAIFCTLAATMCVATASAADTKHPAVDTAKKYLQAVITQDWTTCAGFLYPAVLNQEKQRVLTMVKDSTTMNDEAANLKLLGLASLKELEELPPQKLYVAQRVNAYAGPDKPKFKPNVQLEVVSVGTEDEGRLVHVLFRTVRETDTARYRELILLSLLQDQTLGKSWYVIPDSQIPIVEPLK